MVCLQYDVIIYPSTIYTVLPDIDGQINKEVNVMSKEENTSADTRNTV